ncbi:MAG: D-alanyl-D-alanine carboxypeptidase [Oscillospiraceae bacterium]|jgi:D-alanyl-D-alanine carboxypeptidase (penicillin-binding protein 5/6)|nr:D-alanyl-D-alanine carboxypeptidase [Oscillospiraceae bacterium]
MKTRRFFSLFFCVLIALSLSEAALAAKDDTGDLDVEAKAALLADPETGEILYARNIHERLYPASLTKVMTTLLVLEAVDDGRLSMDQVLTASQEAIELVPADGSNAGIKIGEEMKVEDLLYCVMLVSANEGCNILAEAVSGSVDAFVEDMNERAAAIGCEDTHFVNTNGMPDVNHYTTAWDLYRITLEARKHPDFMPLAGSIYHEVPATNLSDARKLYTTNYLISTYRTDYYRYPGADGIKTGSTSDAGYCLIASATRSGRSLVSVVLGAERIKEEDGTTITKSFTETKKLFDWGFDTFSRQVILGKGESIAEVPVTLSQEVNYVKVHPAREVERLIPNNMDPALDIQRECTFVSESVEAPIQRGQVLGQITLSYGDKVYDTVNLLADSDVSASRLLVFQRDVMLFLQKPAVRYSAAGAVGLVVMIAVLRLFFRSKRRKPKSRSGARSSGYRGRRR